MNNDKPDLASLLRDTARVLETRGNTCDAMRAVAAADEIDRLRADVERHESYGGGLEGRLAEQAECLGAAQAEIDAINAKVLAAVSVLLEFAGRLGVGDDELADRLAEAQMRAEDSAAALDAAPADGEGGAP
jgi:hypothetical protein